MAQWSSSWRASGVGVCSGIDCRDRAAGPSNYAEQKFRMEGCAKRNERRNRDKKVYASR